jgi:hypothetical protein
MLRPIHPAQPASIAIVQVYLLLLTAHQASFAVSTPALQRRVQLEAIVVLWRHQLPSAVPGPTVQALE